MIKVVFKFSHERVVYFINETGIIGYSSGKSKVTPFFRL